MQEQYQHNELTGTNDRLWTSDYYALAENVTELAAAPPIALQLQSVR
jgi:hypothetical protein